MGVPGSGEAVTSRFPQVAKVWVLSTSCQVVIGRLGRSQVLCRRTEVFSLTPVPGSLWPFGHLPTTCHYLVL